MVTRFSAGLALICLLALASGCARARTQRNEQVAPELTFDKLAFRVYRGAVLTAQGVAERASFRRDTADAFAERIEVRLPGTAARPEARVTAVRGAGNLRSRQFAGSAGVLAEQAGQVAVTERAQYAAADGLIRGDRPIEVRGGRFTVRGPSFTLDPREQVLLIGGGANLSAGERTR
jgi:hypothetical protein